MRFVKGHGTQNDFLLLPDLDGVIELTPDAVRAVCARHSGVGADGVLRVVRTENAGIPGLAAGEARFFMDYRNADGSLAEMCGNGVRVFLRYLIAAGLVEQEAAVATRGGIRSARALRDGNVSVDMGSPRFLADRPIVTAALSTRSRVERTDPVLTAVGTSLLIPNPHVVVEVADLAILDALDLRYAPEVAAPLPNGQNVEFVVRRGPAHLAMRVHERGSGETRSCGTGICAAAIAVAAADGTLAEAATWRVDVPGGTCRVVLPGSRTADPAGEVQLIGPAELIGTVDVDDGWLAARVSR